MLFLPPFFELERIRLDPDLDRVRARLAEDVAQRVGGDLALGAELERDGLLRGLGAVDVVFDRQVAQGEGSGVLGKGVSGVKGMCVRVCKQKILLSVSA